MSNVGPNVAMLDAKGRLTDIGSWYLGGKETGVVPTSSLGGRVRGGAGWAWVVGVLVGGVLIW